MTPESDRVDPGVDGSAESADPDVDGSEDGVATEVDESDDRVRESATLPVVEPAVERAAVESDGRVGAVAYPYLVYRASVTMPRAFLGDRTEEYVVSLDRARRLPLRADEHPETVERTVEDALVVPSEVSRERARELARDAVFEWVLRSYSLSTAPDIDLADPVAAYKLFWLAERPDGDVVVDSVRGTERPLEG
ncbi:hypothetical protein [Halobacterium yunchengense]|uniref:hypothetical protein n=1 Tax=Halobacterium yunchengense TaxID=3108497 RepID=UPI00300B3456